MTTSEPLEAYVWVWLPGSAAPVVAGRLDRVGSVLTYTYGQSYLARDDAIALYLPELPLERGATPPLVGEVAGCIADAAPDAWGRRVILNRHAGQGGTHAGDLSLLAYLLESGSDRIGALDFQTSATEYVSRSIDHATLDELAESADRVEAGVPLSPALDQALLNGSSVGGARPKALLVAGSSRFVAKFSSMTDEYPIVKAEFVAMELGRRAALDVAPVEMQRALGKDVLLVERFDRPDGGGRRALVSALTIQGLDEWSARYASYAALADSIRARFIDPVPTVHELFGRIAFNVLVGNNDDHARNHAAFWDGNMLALTPAYDICPQPRSGGEAVQLMTIGRDGYRMSQLTGLVDRAGIYLLDEVEARAIIDRQVEVISSHWGEVCDLAGMSAVDRISLWGRQFLNPYALEGY